jgi:hypothetical protein
MIQLAPLALQPPRISANQLGEFVFASEKRRLSILHDQKFGNINAAPYYGPALAGVRRSFSNGHFSDSLLKREARLLLGREAKTPRQAKQWANNALALQSFADISEESDPPTGEHRLLRKNAQIHLDGVAISVYPEVVTENLTDEFIAFTKLRFSKSKISADVSEIVLLILHYYGQLQSRTGLQFNFERSKVVDCFSKTVILGHAVGRRRDQQLHQALTLIRWLWPQIEPKE